jgi:alpha-glucuronidase
MLGRTLRVSVEVQPGSAIELSLSSDLPADGYTLTTEAGRLLIQGGNDRGVLYGAFALLHIIALHRPIEHLVLRSVPYNSIRWINQWDNLDGSVERGYGGRSIFFEDGHVVEDLTRVNEYARLLASIGINACAVNNVNANPRVLAPDFLPQLARIAAEFRLWGIRMAVSVDLGSPKAIGGLDTFDPLDPKVALWWKTTVDRIYGAIPDFAGFVLKADSEGRVGPSTYGRTHADAANVLASALAAHGGIVIYRGFVYNHHLDWNNLKNDRARAAYDNFHPLDGKFLDNAAVQIKYGPIDFQVREPVSPLIGALQHTNEILELQITQEYTGQQRHVCYLVPMWKEVLDFNLQAPVREIVSGHLTHRPVGGIVGVANVGRDENWLGSDLAMANLYGFGRLAWDPKANAREIASDWTTLTFGNDALTQQVVTNILMQSWPVYESYTGVLGLQTLTDIVHSHYQPNVSAAEKNGWGQWIRADHNGVGMDRSVATGTGFAGQYPPAVANMYESTQTTPENLLLFFHHLPYSYRLHSGETIIQHIYNSHYGGAAEAQQFVAWWESLGGRVDEDRFAAIHRKLAYQAGHAIVWRDSICKWFATESGIPDQLGRVGNYPDRIEAEAMTLDGYRPIDVLPVENASGGKGVICDGSTCTASFKLENPDGWYDLAVQYFDTNAGEAHFEIFRNEQLLDSWTADLVLPSAIPNGDTSTRRTIRQVALRNGDLIRIIGKPDRGDKAALDYISVDSVPMEAISLPGISIPDRR